MSHSHKAGNRNSRSDRQRIRDIRAAAHNIQGITLEMEPDDEDAPPEPTMTEVILGKSHKSTQVQVKAVTPDTVAVAGYGVIFGGHDLEGETFTPQTDYMLDLVPTKLVLYDHSLGTVKHIIGKTVAVEPDEFGIWVEAELNRHAAYVEQIRELAEKGALGWSSGSAGHLTRREGKSITAWPILEFSLTPTPAEPRTLGVEVLKSLANVDATYSALLPEGGTPPAQDADGADTDATKSVDSVPMEDTKMDNETTPTVDVEAMAESIATKAFEKYNALVKPDNPIDVATKGVPAVIPTLGDNPTKALLHYVRTGQDTGLATKAYNNTDMNIATPADGGYAVPTPMLQQIIARRDELAIHTKVGVRNIPGKGLTVNIPLDSEADVLFTSVAEAAAIAQDAPALGQAAMTLAKFGKAITLSWELLRDEDANLEAFLNDWLARGWAATLNNLLITEAAANGTADGTLPTTITAASIMTLIGALAPEYQDGAAFIMHPTTYANISGLTGNPFQFIQTPAGAFTGPSISGYPVHRSSYAAAPAASAKTVLFGNWNFMGFREATDLTILRDPYSAAGTGQVKLWVWFDAVFRVLQPEAIVYGTQST